MSTAVVLYSSTYADGHVVVTQQHLFAYRTHINTPLSIAQLQPTTSNMSSDKRTDAVYMAKVSLRLAVARRRCACLVLTLEYTTLRAMQQQQQQLSEQAERYDEMVSYPL